MRFASHLIKKGAKPFRESFDSKLGFKARFASHLIQNGASNARFPSHLSQNLTSKCVSRVI